MDKLEVSPRSVRGYGNIIIPKLSTDFVGKYNEIYTDEDGYFVLSYGGVMLKASATVSNTIKGIQASLTVLVSTRDSDTPVSGLSVDCSVDDVALTGQTTDSTGKCTFTWTPSDLGDSSLLISVTPQDDYAGLSLDKTVTVGLLLGFYEIMTSLSLEDDEVYTGTFEEQVEDRSQLSEFVKDVWVASGGEPIVDEYGIIHICEPGDLVVESEGLEQLPEYSNVLFEEDVDLLTGAVYDMSISEDYEIVLDCLERSDIVPDVPTVNVILTSSESSVTYGDTVVLTVSVSEDGVPVSGGTVSFYNGVTLLGTDTTDSSGEASLSTSSLSVGSHSLSAKYDDSTSNIVTVTVSDVPAPTPASVSLTSDKSILSYADSESATLSATVLDSGSNPLEGVTVEFFKGSTSLGTADTNSSGVATKSYASAGSGDVSFTAEADSIISSEIYVEDCLRYNTSTYTSKTTFTYPLPSTFKIEFDSLITQTTSNSCFVRIGESEGKALLTGKVGSGDSVYKVYARKSSTGTGDIVTSGNSISPSNDWQHQTITFDGTTYSYQGMSITNFNTVSLTYLHSFDSWKSGTTSGQIKNIKVKPL